MKSCTTCSVNKPIREFYRRSTGARYSECKSCNNIKNKKFKANNPDKRFKVKQRNWLKEKYGITKEQFEAMLASQNGCCAICHGDNPKHRNWIVDHCHKTGRIRGLLCHSCNVALGHIRDSVAVLEAMKAYLLKHTDIEQS